jgi:class 3 adenylate cyclase
MLEADVLHRERVYRWEWSLRSSPEALWPLVADTNRFNRDVGLSGVESRPAADGRRRVRLGRLIEWEEEPFEWERLRRFSVRRRFLRGPIAELRVAAELEPENGGTRMVYAVYARSRNVVGALAIPLQIGRRSARRFEETIRRYDDLASSPSNRLLLARRVRLAAGGRERLGERSRTLIDEGQDSELVRRLGETIERGDELELARLRPYRLADAWGAERRAVLELFLRATRVGLLDLQWDLLCPLCRGPQESAPRLAEVNPDVHCETCGIDFKADFERSVELTFRPNQSIREIDVAQYCVGGPRVTPHIVLQQRLGPREERTVQVPLEPGAYRLRVQGRSGTTALAVEGGPTEVRLSNDLDEPGVAVLERTAWADDAATAAEVTALQVFRDLFVNEVVRPGEPVSVGSLAVLFTDLLGSTRYYREVGDPTAYASVRDHLQVLHDAVAAEHGALVKTMGDAIMAVFRSPAAGIRAVLRARDELGGRPLVLKAGLHYGPCIAVNQNDRLDYFGSTVNAAARLVALSEGDLVLSGAVRDDPEVRELLDDAAVEPLDAELRGFDERFELWRLRR